MKKLKLIFILLAIILSDIMCALVAFSYSSMLCSIKHGNCSAPASVAFIYAIPFGIGIMVCAVLAYVFHKKAQQKLR